MKVTASDLPDLSGCVAVVTGANSGLGLATAGPCRHHRRAIVDHHQNPHPHLPDVM